MTHRFASILLLAALPFAACENNNDTQTLRVDPQRDLFAAAAASAGPSERPGNAFLREALTGLDFSTGRVVVTAETDLSPQQAEAASAAKAAEAESLLTEQNQLVPAIGAASQALMLDPDNPARHTGLGHLLMLKGKNAEAEACLRTALDLQPDALDAQMHLANLLYGTGRYDEAIALWKETLAIDPDHGQAHFELALALYYAGDYQGSQLHADRAAALGQPMPPQFAPLLQAALGG